MGRALELGDSVVMGDRRGELERLRDVIEARRPHLVLPRRTDRAGNTGPTRHAARTRWRRAYAGLYVPGHVTATAEQLIIEVASVVVAHPAAISEWAALCWRGARWFDGTTPDGAACPVPITIGTFDRRGQSGIRYHGESLPPVHIEIVDGVRLMVPVRAVADAVRRAPTPREAMRIASMAAYDDLVSTAELSAYATTCGPMTGVNQLRETVAVMSENCWSPREVDLLWDWRAAELPTALMNVPVFDLAGRHLGTPDLLAPEVGVAVEYDGIVHLDSVRRRGDLRRDSTFRRAGIETAAMVAGMDADERMARMREACARSVAAPERPRSWTAQPPDWWIDTTTVEARRRLTPDQRARLLRYRDAA